MLMTIADAYSGIAFFHDSSRLLLTIGVGLFLGYLVMLIGANIVGLIHRRVTHQSRVQKPVTKTAIPRQPSTSRPVRQVARVPAGARSWEHELL